MGRAGQLAVFVVSVAVGGAALHNVFADNSAVRAQAEAAACARSASPSGCAPQTTRMEKSPIGQQFEVHTKDRTVVVDCHRSLYLFGAYACATE